MLYFPIPTRFSPLTTSKKTSRIFILKVSFLYLAFLPFQDILIGPETAGLFPLLSLSVRLVLNHLQSVNLGITCYIFHSFYKVYVEKCVKSVVNDAFLVFLYSIFCINRNMSIRIVRVNKPRR